MKELIDWLETQCKQMDYEIAIEMNQKVKQTKIGVLMGYNTTLAYIRMNYEAENSNPIGFFR